MATTIDHDPTHHPLLDKLAENWWVVALRGVVAIAFGALALFWPGSALLSFVLVFGVFAFADGILSFMMAFTKREGGMPTWWLVVMGIVGVVAGVAAFVWPGITAAMLVLLIASWAIVAGIFEIIGAIELRKEIDNEWLLILGGVLSVLFGLFLFLSPGIGALAIVFAIAFYALLLGGSWIGLAFRLRRHANRAAK